MPGVTVEAASPVLIERRCAAVTDGAGRYAIIDLRPGTYTVTFTLPGFNKVRARRHRARRRVLRAGERVAVGRRGRGDGHRHRRVAGRRYAEHAESGGAQPPGARRAAGRAHDAGRRGLVPGVSFYSQGFVSTMSMHGSATADQHIFFDGMNIGQNLTGTGSQGNGVGVNELAQTELVYDAGSQSAENALGGVRMDSIPKEGGNNFSGVVAHASARRARCRTTTSPTSCGRSSRPARSSITATTPTPCSAGRFSKNKLWFLLAQRVSQYQQPDSRCRTRVLPARAARRSRAGQVVAALDRAADLAGVAAQQDRLGVLQVAGRHAALRRRLHRDQRQQRRRAFRRKRRTALPHAAAVRQRR